MNNNYKQIVILIIIVAVVILVVAGYIHKQNKNQSTGMDQNVRTQKSSVDSESLSKKATDYSISSHWLALPVSTEKAIDIFYVYPTAWQKVGKDDPNICEIDDASMLVGSRSAFSRQATAFEDTGNIYAPYYRQADAAYTLALPLKEQEKVVGGVPKSDVFAAFDYYIKHYNNGRPFILAGHSQGSNMLVYLLSEYMKENPDVYSRMIAAYVIGYSVTDDYLANNSHLKFAQSAGDTGVIISYNTEAPSIPGKNPVVLPGALAINPITWSRDEIVVSAENNLGSLALNKDGTPVRDNEGKILVVKNYADARVDKNKGVLISSTMDDSKLVLGFGPGIYHTYDYPFYYFNIKENAALRAKNFLQK